jgi:hypothetical protein
VDRGLVCGDWWEPTRRTDRSEKAAAPTDR